VFPVVSIIGKPNVGKSTLFNRLVGYRKAVVSPTPGTTRDRHFARVEDVKPYLLVDTGGIETETKGDLEESVLEQAKLAIEEATLILFLIDVKLPMTQEDHHVADLLRKSGKKVLLIASKSDSGTEDLSELHALGFAEPLQVSAVHNAGLATLELEILDKIPKVKAPKKAAKKSIRLAVLGRPNVGKSSLINRIIGQEKLIVSAVQGTTIDSTDISFEHGDIAFTLVDTAGIRRRGKRGKGIEKYSFMRSLTAAQGAEVCILLIDAEEGATSQDQHILEYVLKSTPGLILAINKLDLMEKGEEERNLFLGQVQRKFSFVSWAPVVFISAKSGKNVEKVLELAQEIREQRSTRIETNRLNRWLEKVIHKHMPSGAGRRVPKLMYITQVGIDPPHFIIFGKFKGAIHFSYTRYVENQLRESFGFSGTAIKVEYRAEEPRSKR